MTKSNINGLILAGGKSSRMGQDKGMLYYYGKPQREHLFGMLQSFCKDVYTSCGSNQEIPKQLNPLPDQFELDSPLNGILTAFQLNSTHAWLSVPVDMPLIDQETFQALIENRDFKKLATCFWDSTGKLPEPLLTLWEPGAKNSLLAFYEQGGISPREWLSRNDVNIIDIPDKKYLININTNQEYDDLVKLLQNRGK